MAELKDLYMLLARSNPDRRLTRKELREMAASYGKPGVEPQNDGVSKAVGRAMITAAADEVAAQDRKNSKATARKLSR